jgi:hypothetical protein
MRVYSYSWATGEYIGDTEADASPLEPGVYLLPAYTTAKAPPDMNEFPGMRPVFDVEANDWILEDKPPEPKTPIEDRMKKMTDNLFGDMMIGDLFNGHE